MIQFRVAHKSVFSFFLSAASAIVITLGGCKSQNGDHQELVFDLAVIGLTNIVEKNEASDSESRAEAALSKLKNGVLDTEPMLMHAGIGFPEPNHIPLLGLTCFDEDRDLRGLRIKEKYIDSNGTTTTLEEDYPVFVSKLKPLILEVVMYPIQIRDKYQRKDICLWLDYSNWNLDRLIREYVDKREHDAKGISPREVPSKEMPPIYISIPDPNRVHVFMSVYDREGHESESIELLAKPEFKVFKSEYVPQHTTRSRE